MRFSVARARSIRHPTRRCARFRRWPMPEAIGFSVDGRRASAKPGISVAAALENAGASACRVSVTGDLRGPLCAMGICYECRVSIDGTPYRRACMEVIRDGMAIGTRPSQLPGSGSRIERAESVEYEVAVVGGGPAGIAA